ncbi:MarR family winged helix-turn-helix transcriptional regulator [Ferrovibrio sp.]|uniref:MarR family winged helix-turn-helix transcriptional regulator n=1 Tax=Ferrovibrio sp. TaxID=1917215 RepID=UPI003D0A965F
MNSPSDLTDHLGYWLRLVSNQVSQNFATRLAAEDVTVAEWVMLRALHGQPPMAPSRLAEMMGMTRGAITKLADRLIAKDMLLRQSDPADGRAQTLHLTPRGSRLVPKLATHADRNDSDFFRALSAAEQKVLRRLLQQLATHHRISGMATE